MIYGLAIALLNLALLVAMLLLIAVGRRIGARHLKNDPEGMRSGLGAVEAAVLALLGLLLAFTITGAGGRFDIRRHQIVEESNAIGDAYRRLDVLPAATQPALRQAFRDYVDSRVAVYRKLRDDIPAAKRELATVGTLQDEIWKQAVAAVRADGASPYAASLVLPALNAMFDIASTRTMASQLHTPLGVFVILFVLALAGALLSGYGMAAAKSGSWLHILCFVVVVVATIFVIIELEYPRLGWIRIDAFDQALADLRARMQ